MMEHSLRREPTKILMKNTRKLNDSTNVLTTLLIITRAKCIQQTPLPAIERKNMCTNRCCE
uniref:Uncharacterized protein n=1 Tax=Ascaris lumbricoides TaxID=6252 RepID=A0A0M3ITI2_ASCLU